MPLYCFLLENNINLHQWIIRSWNQICLSLLWWIVFHKESKPSHYSYCSMRANDITLYITYLGKISWLGDIMYMTNNVFSQSYHIRVSHMWDISVCECVCVCVCVCVCERERERERELLWFTGLMYFTGLLQWKTFGTHSRKEKWINASSVNSCK